MATRSILRPKTGAEAVTRFIASPFEALPGPFRFAAAGWDADRFVPDGITEAMRR